MVAYIKRGSLSNIALSEKMLTSVMHIPTSLSYPNDSNIDLVYIVKPGENNPDLKFSLRSVSKFCKFKNIWIIGYKPQWITGVYYIPTIQKSTKWKNSTLNWLTACKCLSISNDFVLMNDDFFAIKPINNWQTELNVCLGMLNENIAKYANKNKSRWQAGFEYAEKLLLDLNCKNTFCYEAHVPMLINKQNFITLMENPIIQDFTNTDKVLHKRTIYKNIYPEIKLPKQITDVKLNLNEDLSDMWLSESWLSVFDNVTENFKQFPVFNKFLTTLFPNKCKYEI